MTPLAPPVAVNEYYELRLYEMMPGRLPGFLPQMFDVALPHFTKYGIPRPLALWTSHTGPMAPLFAYLIRWDCLDRRMHCWNAFYADPIWSETLAQNFAGGTRIRRTQVLILRPGPFQASLANPARTGPVGGLHDLAFHDLDNDAPHLGHEALATIDLPHAQAQGGQVLGTFATWYGARMNQAVTLTAWPDAEAWRAATSALLHDEGVTRRHDTARIARG
ncbi:MAG: NIPSNAP family protein, partial [Pseudomonadota bacterium]|nr:NIPSNAP family protein [Pseudomonadota bacterium]